MQRVNAVLRERLIWQITASVLVLLHATTATATSASTAAAALITASVATPLRMNDRVLVFSVIINFGLATASL